MNKNKKDYLNPGPSRINTFYAEIKKMERKKGHRVVSLISRFFFSSLPDKSYKKKWWDICVLVCGSVFVCKCAHIVEAWFILLLLFCSFTFSLPLPGTGRKDKKMISHLLLCTRQLGSFSVVVRSLSLSLSFSAWPSLL